MGRSPEAIAVAEPPHAAERTPVPASLPEGEGGGVPFGPVARLDWLVQFCGGLVVALLGLTVQVGWWRHRESLTAWFPGGTPMPMGTALGFMLAGTSLMILSHPGSGRVGKWVGRVVNTALLSQAVIVLTRRLFVPIATSRGAGEWLGTVTAFEFVLVGVALILLERGVLPTVARALAVLCGSTALITISGLLGGLAGASTGWGLTSTTVHGEVGVLLLAICLLQESVRTRADVHRERWSLVALLLAVALMVLATVSAWVNLHHVREVVTGMESSRVLSRRLECIEDDLAELSGFGRFHSLAARHPQSVERHVEQDLAAIDRYFDMHTTGAAEWPATRDAILRMRATARSARAGAGSIAPPGTSVIPPAGPGVVQLEHVRLQCERLERVVEGEWDDRSEDMLQWGGTTSLATGLVAMLGITLLAILGLALWRVNTTLEARVRQRTVQLEESMQANRQGQHRLQLAIEGTGIGFWEWNVVTNQIRWDVHMFRLYGLDPTPDGFVPYDAWARAVFPEDLPTQESVLQETVRAVGRSAREFRIRRWNDGEVRILSAVERARAGASGATDWVVGTNLDVTEQRRAEEELRRFSADLEARVVERNAQVLAASKRATDIQHALDEHAIVDLSDLTGRITYVNDRFCELTGYTREELLGQDHRILNSGVHPRGFFAELRRTIQTGRIWKGQVCNRAKDGSLHWVATTVVPILDADGQPEQYVVIRDDITDARNARQVLESTNAELGQRTRELERSNSELEQFAYVASHDLQEPLRAVSGCVQLLQAKLAGRGDAVIDELAGHAVDGVGRMHALIQSLLQYSRIGTRSGERVPTPTEDVLATALTDLSAAIQESGAVVTHDPLPVIDADAAQLRQLFVNLIGNAIKFRGQRRPEIHVSARRDPAAWAFEVRDNGIGIEPRYHERIFEMFQRLHTREEYPGTGIGLAICRKIVERHGGRMSVESELGKGTKFCFMLADPEPRRDAPAR